MCECAHSPRSLAGPGPGKAAINAPEADTLAPGATNDLLFASGIDLRRRKRQTKDHARAQDCRNRRRGPRGPPGPRRRGDPALVDPNDYRDDIAKLVEQKTGRPLQIRGDLDLKLFPWLALDIHDVTLGNPPAYGSEPFLTVQKASVGVKLFPLLRKQVEVSRVAIEGLAVTLVSRSDEDNNWKDLGESKETEQPAETARRRPSSPSPASMSRSRRSSTGTRRRRRCRASPVSKCTRARWAAAIP